MGKYIVFTLFFIGSVAHAEFDINKGFSYENKKERQPQSEANQAEQKNQKVEILRFYNESSKVTDPLTDVSENTEIKFLKLKDKTLKKPKLNKDAERALSSATPVDMDMEATEIVLRNLEQQQGVKSMPVINFAGNEEFNTNQFLDRVIYLEQVLKIYNKEQNNLMTLSERLHKIKEAQMKRASASQY